MRKLSAAGIGGAVGILLCWFIGMVPYIASHGGVPPEIAVAWGSVCTFIASVLIPDDKEE